MGDGGRASQPPDQRLGYWKFGRFWHTKPWVSGTPPPKRAPPPSRTPRPVSDWALQTRFPKTEGPAEEEVVVAAIRHS